MKPKKKVRKSGYYVVRTTITDLEIAEYKQEGDYWQLFGRLHVNYTHEFISISKNKISTKREMIIVDE